MKLAFFNDHRLGLVGSGTLTDVTSALAALSAVGYPYPRHDAFYAALPSLRGAIEAAAMDAPAIPLSDVRLLSPVLNAGKIVAAPVNYKAHLDEAVADEKTFPRAHVRTIQESGLFLKVTSSVIGATDEIVLAFDDRRTDHEVELAVVIGRRCRHATINTALDHVAGYCIGLDITVRGPEERSFRKSPDTYTVLGPWLVTADELGDSSALDLQLEVNGEMRQRANTRDLILDVRELIVFASRFYTLEPGDVLLTGTPEGVGPIQPGDTLRARIERIGEMSVRVAEGGSHGH